VATLPRLPSDTACSLPRVNSGGEEARAERRTWAPDVWHRRGWVPWIEWDAGLGKKNRMCWASRVADPGIKMECCGGKGGARVERQTRVSGEIRDQDGVFSPF
jgi:hypothetical protein